MQKFTIYVAEPDTIEIDLIKEILKDANYHLIEGSPDFSKGDAATCDTLIIRSVAQVDATIKQKMPHLARVARVGTGLDNVDLDFCAKENIAVYNAPGANAEAVADYAIAVTMMALRKLHLLQPADVASWNRFKFTGYDIATRTVGIVGFGNIGNILYKKFRGLGCRDFLVYDPFIKQAPEYAQLMSLDELVKKSDIISLHVPLLPQTKHCIGIQNIGTLKEGAILLNASRGGIVDEDAVIEALQTKQFTYIADTVEGEPSVNPGLLNNEDVIITPHIASLTRGAEAAMVVGAITNLLADKRAVVIGR